MLVVSDLHFTDKPMDRYRFRIFTWIHEYFMETADKNLLILGDLTDSKDHHSANLVDAIVTRLHDLTAAGMEVFILKGNHDYIDPDTPFFKFLDRYEYINFIVDPQCILIEGLKCLFLPHTRNPIQDWKEDRIVEKYRKKADVVYMHESVIGSVTSSGYEMEQGLLPSYFRRFSGKVISGDIHCPQTVGRVMYVGTPYSIRFNDHYRGQALSVAPDQYNQTSVMVTKCYPDIRGRWTFDISSVDELVATGTQGGDQIKIRYQLSEEEEPKWDSIRKRIHAACEEADLELCSLQVVRPEKLPLRGRKHRNELQKAYDVLMPKQVVDDFSKQQGLSAAKRKAGQRMVDDD